MKRLEDRQIELDTPGSKVNMDLPGLPQVRMWHIVNHRKRCMTLPWHVGFCSTKKAGFQRNEKT